jgi:hypothetical protein
MLITVAVYLGGGGGGGGVGAGGGDRPAGQHADAGGFHWPLAVCACVLNQQPVVGESTAAQQTIAPADTHCAQQSEEFGEGKLGPPEPTS